MGRYYSGDINGKFWFGVQASNDADHFGQRGYRPERLNYYFEDADLPKVKKELRRCRTELGKYKKAIDDFFKKNNGYNDEMMARELHITTKKLASLLEIYARLELGNKILTCLKNHGSCEFEAEL